MRHRCASGALVPHPLGAVGWISVRTAVPTGSTAMARPIGHRVVAALDVGLLARAVRPARGAPAEPPGGRPALSSARQVEGVVGAPTGIGESARRAHPLRI